MNLKIETRERFSKAVFVVFLIFLVWSLLQFLAPLSIPSDSLKDLTGLSLISDNYEDTENIPIPFNFVYSAGDRLCHQKAERSFFINGNQMPFCSRCTAIWIGLVIGLLVMIFYKIDFDEKILFLLLIGIAPLGIDGFGQLFGLWESLNLIRLLTGLFTGVVCGIAFGVIIDEFKDMYINRARKSVSYTHLTLPTN